MPTDRKPARQGARGIAGGQSSRPAIQGLRTLAVGLVVFFHLWPSRLTGGYVGVDVFFVISGFLIMSHLVREVESTGSLRVVRFWARRIRRLLPASLLVLALATPVVFFWGPSAAVSTTLRHLAASALSVQNWALATEAVDYLSADTPPTVAQHYWSLSVEEQFYAAWPLLVIAAIWLYGLRSRSHSASRSRSRSGEAGSALADPSAAGRRRVLTAVLTAVAVPSFVWSVVSTHQDPAFAYFSTLTRAWEFAAGALLALATSSLPRRLGVAAGWIGSAAILLSGVILTPASVFPGWVAAMPVLGTVLALAGHDDGRCTAGWWLSLRPMVWLGDLSYSIYLVHWPLIVMLPWFTGRPLQTPEKLAILVATIALAWASKTFVEDPARQGTLLGKQTWRAVGFALVAGGLVAGSNLLLRQEVEDRQQASLERAEGRGSQTTPGGTGSTSSTRSTGPGSSSGGEPSPYDDRPCHGPNALLTPSGCSSVSGKGPLALPLALTAAGANKGYLTRCLQGNDVPDLKSCTMGDTEHPTARWALLGDSHAGSFAPTLDFVGQAEHLEVVTYAKGACPASLARRVLKSDPSPARAESCDVFNEQALAAVLADDQITDVVVVQRLHAYKFVSRPGHRLADPTRDGFTRLWRQLAAAGKRVHVVSEWPTVRERAPSCLEDHPDDPVVCGVPRSELPDDPVPGWVNDLADPKISVLDLTPAFCDESTCYARVGDVAVYQDANHLSYEYARMLAPFATRQLEASSSP